MVMAMCAPPESRPFRISTLAEPLSTPVRRVFLSLNVVPGLVISWRMMRYIAPVTLLEYSQFAPNFAPEMQKWHLVRNSSYHRYLRSEDLWTGTVPARVLTRIGSFVK